MWPRNRGSALVGVAAPLEASWSSRWIVHRAGEEFDDVEDFLAGVVELGAGAELQETAGVGGDDGLGTRGGGVAHFLGE
jgi:hypothetical protein